MSDDWVVGFKAALLRYVQNHGHSEATEVTDWDDSAEYNDGCYCYSGMEYEVNISYMKPGYKYSTYYTFKGKFTDLLYELTED